MQLTCLELEELAVDSRNIQSLTKALVTAMDDALDKNVKTAREYIGGFRLLEGVLGHIAERLEELAH